MKTVSDAKIGTFFGVSGGLSHLEKQIKTGEEPLLVVQGQMDDTAGVLAATSERVLFSGKFLFSTVLKELSYSKLNSISIESGILNSKIKFEYSGGNLEVKAVGKAEAKEFVEIVQAKINDQAGSPKKEPDLAKDDMFEKLKKLAELKELGILTEEEFQQQKQKLLS
jgi:Bacterial PH domain/Short C-terminal domain